MSQRTTISLRQLKRLGACKEKAALFKKLFGNKVEVTEEMCIKHARDFDFAWAADKFLGWNEISLWSDKTDTAFYSGSRYLASVNARWFARIFLGEVKP